jgi:hypothetical protein
MAAARRSGMARMSFRMMSPQFSNELPPERFLEIQSKV